MTSSFLINHNSPDTLANPADERDKYRGEHDCKPLIAKIKLWGHSLGLTQIGVTTPQLSAQQIAKLNEWLANGYYGTMSFMQQHQDLRIAPYKLMPGVASIICCRMDYPQPQITSDITISNHISPYALTRDYHKVMHQRLSKLTKKIMELEEYRNFQYRIFCDSAPVLEKSLAAQAKLGWIGKNTLLINKQSGTNSFLGEIYTDLPLASFMASSVIKSGAATAAYEATHSDTCSDARDSGGGENSNCDINCDIHEEKDRHSGSCGACTLCLDACPTKALYAPYSLDARRCIAYLTIEHQGAIAEELRALLGTKIFGCTICQKCCPWNGDATKPEKINVETTSWAVGKIDRAEWAEWQSATLAQLFLWNEETYLARTAGTPLRRLGHIRWLRNIAIALGNSPPSPENCAALTARLDHPSALVREHVTWALKNIEKKFCFNSRFHRP